MSQSDTPGGGGDNQGRDGLNPAPSSAPRSLPPQGSILKKAMSRAGERYGNVRGGASLQNTTGGIQSSSSSSVVATAVPSSLPAKTPSSAFGKSAKSMDGAGVTFPSSSGDEDINGNIDGMKTMPDKKSIKSLSLSSILPIPTPEPGSNAPSPREIVRYFFFLALFTTVVYVSREDANAYFYASQLRDLFVGEEYPAASSHVMKTVEDAATFDEMWQWLEGPFVDALHQEDWYNGDPFDGDESKFILGHGLRVGVGRLRQVRSVTQTCTTLPSQLSQVPFTCYPELEVEYEDTAEFGPDGREYTWSAAGDEPSFLGKLRTYSGAGYVTELGQSHNETLTIIETLKADRWVDWATRAVFVDFNIYNANYNLFAVNRVLFEAPNFGGVIPSSTFRTVRIFRYVTLNDYIIAAMEVLFVGFVIWYIWEEASEFRQQGNGYFRHAWNWVDLTNLFIFGIVIALRIYTLVRTGSVDFDPDAGSYVNLNGIAFLLDQERNVNAVNIFLCWFKVFKYLQVYPRMSQLSRTLAVAFSDIIAFLFMFFIIFFGFSHAGFMIFGGDLFQFRSIGHSMGTLFRAMLGDFDYGDLQGANRFLGPAFFLLYMSLVFFVLTNMFLAIINDSYSEVKRETEEGNVLDDFHDLIRSNVIRLVESLHSRREAVSKFGRAFDAGDEDGDGTLNMKELDQVIEQNKDVANAAGVADGKELLNAYDKNNDNVLDQAEQAQLRADLATRAGVRSLSGTESTTSFLLHSEGEQMDGDGATLGALPGAALGGRSPRRGPRGRAGGYQQGMMLEQGQATVERAELRDMLVDIMKVQATQQTAMMQVRGIDQVEERLAATEAKLDALLAKLDGSNSA